MLTILRKSIHVIGEYPSGGARISQSYGDDSQNSLAMIIIQLLIKEIITYTYAESKCFIFHSI